MSGIIKEDPALCCRARHKDVVVNAEKTSAAMITRTEGFRSLPSMDHHP